MNYTKSDALTDAKIKKLKVQTEREKLKLQLETGEVVKRSDVSKQWADQVTRVKNKLLSIPSKIASHWAGVEKISVESYSATAKKFIDEALLELAEDYEKED